MLFGMCRISYLIVFINAVSVKMLRGALHDRLFPCFSSCAVPVVRYPFPQAFD